MGGSRLWDQALISGNHYPMKVASRLLANIQIILLIRKLDHMAAADKNSPKKF